MYALNFCLIDKGLQRLVHLFAAGPMDWGRGELEGPGQLRHLAVVHGQPGRAGDLPRQAGRLRYNPLTCVPGGHRLHRPGGHHQHPLHHRLRPLLYVQVSRQQ